MATEKTRKTFLSYSRSNKDFAIKLARELKSEGFDVWLDTLDIPLGSRWDREVERALKESEIFMIILTPSSVGSENVLDEIGYAIDTHKRILPILLENCEVPLRLRRLQYIDFTKKSFDEGLKAAKTLLLDLSMQTKDSLGKINAGQDVSAQAEWPSKSYKIRNTKEMTYQQKNEEVERKWKSGRRTQPVPASRTLNKSFPMGLVAIFSAILLIVVALFFALIYIRLPVLLEQAATNKTNPTLVSSVDAPSVQPIVNSVLPTSTPTVYPTDTPVPSLTPTNTSIPPTATSTEAPSPCEMLDGKSISATQIGYNGRRYQVVFGPQGIQLVDKGGEKYSFSTLSKIEGDPIIDSVVGTCEGSILLLTRTRPSANNFIQVLKGELTLANGVVTVEGTFNHNTSDETYRWFGSIVEPSP